jgi:hypothetical protein
LIDQVRTVRFENGGMVLAPPRRLYAGVMQRQELFWERVAWHPENGNRNPGTDGGSK